MTCTGTPDTDFWKRAENGIARFALPSRSSRPAMPSIRIPVTPANRRLLRRIRARELADWQQPKGANITLEHLRPVQPAEDAVAQRLFMFLALATVGALVQHGSALFRFVEGWSTFAGWIGGGLK